MSIEEATVYSTKAERYLAGAAGRLEGFQLIDVYRLSEDPERYSIRLQFMRISGALKSIVPVPMHAAIHSREREIFDVEAETSLHSTLTLRLKQTYAYEQAIPPQARIQRSEHIDAWIEFVADGIVLNFRAMFDHVDIHDVSDHLLLFLAEYFSATTEAYRAIFAGRATHNITGHA